MGGIFLDLPPGGYTPGTVLSPSQNIWDNATLASLGITPGTYTWSWGNFATGNPSFADQSFTIDVVPLPATLPLLGGGLGALGLLGWRRKRRTLAVA